jgi:uncharacterized protein (TIGR02594 family)
MKLPLKYRYLEQTPQVPALVKVALADLGTLEKPGTPDNPKIIAWADEVAAAMPTPYAKWAADWYNDDSIPWCGLAAAVWAVRSSAGKTDRLPPKSYLTALAWADFGEPVQWKGKEGSRLENIWVGDVLVFVRSGGGHVGVCVGVSSNGQTVHVLGGNQRDTVSITEIQIGGRLYAVRRPPYTVRPAGARHVRVSSSGIVSTNEQ